MEIKRGSYLKQLIAYRFDGLVKVITGIRRCGKSYLLKKIYKEYLLQNGIKEEQIIVIELDLAKDIKYRNPLFLASYVREQVEHQQGEYYLFVDEIQMSDQAANPYHPEGAKITFYDALNDLGSLDNLDVYVTGSNSKMLSTDILTEFRGRSDEIRVHPLSFSEYVGACKSLQETVNRKNNSIYSSSMIQDGLGTGLDVNAAFNVNAAFDMNAVFDVNVAFNDYAFYGGMPLVLSRPNDEAKMQYLKSLFSEVYIKDIVERKRIERQEVLELIVDLISSSIGSLTNPTKIADTLSSKHIKGVSSNTIRAYMDHLEDAFLFTESKRYDVKGKSYFDSPSKYYCEDIGLRNARVGFRQQEMTHIMENIIYNELIIRRFSVDVGVVYGRTVNQNGNSVRTPREIDFVVHSGSKKTYIQSAYAMLTEEKEETELRPFALVGDSFPKIVVTKDGGRRWYDEQGILHIGLIDFLMDKDLI
jgi:predicted AAA+ superfamily ATPase